MKRTKKLLKEQFQLAQERAVRNPRDEYYLGVSATLRWALGLDPIPPIILSEENGQSALPEEELLPGVR